MLGICRLSVLNETLLVPVVLTYGSEKMLWKENEKSRTRAVQMDNLRGSLVIRRMENDPNTRIMELYGVTKGFMRVFSGGLAMCGRWRRTGLLREFM